jgi:aminopeptidase N
VLQLEQKLLDAPVIHRNLDDMDKVLNNLVYQKGGWVLHMLRQEVGTEPFWTAIREYYRAIATATPRPRICARSSSRCRASRSTGFSRSG